MSETVLTCNQLSKHFGQARKARVLSGLDFEVGQGAVVGLIGPNGAGKTTLIKCILGLLHPTGGEARVFGEAGQCLSGQCKARVGYVPQQLNIYPWMKVQQVLNYQAAFYPHWNHEWIAHLRETWALDAKQRVAELSVGQGQKLGILLAMGHEPDLLLLDEPASALDPGARREFLATLLEIVGDGGRTILFSTHITQDVERVADQVAIMGQGRILAHEPLDRLKERIKRLDVRIDGGDTGRRLTTDLPGVIRSEFNGQSASLTVDDASGDLADQITQRWGADVRVHRLNLEEIFMELSRD